MESKMSYADRYDGALEVIMVLVMIISVVAVVVLNVAVRKDCTTQKSVFCGTQVEAKAHH